MGPARTPTQADFTRLYESEFDYVWNALRRLGIAEAHVEDVAHDVFTTAWKKLADYDPTRPIRPWLFGIAYRLASDFRARAWQCAARRKGRAKRVHTQGIRARQRRSSNRPPGREGVERGVGEERRGGRRRKTA